MFHSHLEALHSSLDIPFDDTLTIRANKRQIIEGLGFGSGSNPTEFVNVPPGKLGEADIRSVLTDSLGRDMYSALLIEDGGWQHIGGAPVVYVMHKGELPEKLLFGGQGNIEQVQTTSGTYVPSAEAGLKVFARKKSVTSTIRGFDNYSEPMGVRLGGGFRLQIDTVGYEEGKPFLTMSAHFSFNDYGSRVLARENEEDARVPMASKSFRVPIVNGKLDLPIKDLARSEVSTTNEAIDLVMSELFTNDGEAIDNLTRQLLTIRPAMQVHQFEGIYGVTDEYGISAEVIDFDGLDAFDITPTAPTGVERLAGSQLVQAGYLKETDSGARVVYYKQQAEIRTSLSRLNLAEEISETVNDLASLRAGEDITAYANRLSAYGRLARSIGYCAISWQETSAPNVKQASVNGYTITKVEAGGFKVAFIERGGQLVPVTNAREIYDLAKQVLGQNMLRLYVSLSREGD